MPLSIGLGKTRVLAHPGPAQAVAGGPASPETLAPAFQRAPESCRIQQRAGQGWTGAAGARGALHFLPPCSSLASLLSICFSRLFAKCEPVCLVCFFFNSFLFPRFRVKVHVHSVPHCPPGCAVPDTKLAGPAHVPQAPAQVPTPTWQGPVLRKLGFAEENILVPVPGKWGCFCARVRGRTGLGILGPWLGKMTSLPSLRPVSVAATWPFAHWASRETLGSCFPRRASPPTPIWQRELLGIVLAAGRNLGSFLVLPPLPAALRPAPLLTLVPLPGLREGSETRKEGGTWGAPCGDLGN